MEIFKITDGSADIHVFARTKDEALTMREVRDYYSDFLAEERLEKLTAERLVPDTPLKITFEKHKIRLKVEEWISIRDIGSKVLCQTEY